MSDPIPSDPIPSDPVSVQCPSCQARFRVTADKLGRTFTCPKCAQPFQATASTPVQPPTLEPLPVYADPTPPPLPASPIGYATPGRAGNDPMSGPPTRTNGMSIASLVCGCMVCFTPASLLAIVFGIVGLNQTKAGRQRGRGMAVAGLVLGCLGLLFLPLMISILLPSLNRAREVANRAKCASNMHQIGLGILLYQQDHQQQYPPDLATLWQTEQLSGPVFVCPSSNDTPAASPAQLTSGGHLSYVYLPPAPNTVPNANAPVLYENGADHGNDGTNVLFGDGHVSWLNAAAAKALLGTPQP